MTLIVGRPTAQAHDPAVPSDPGSVPGRGDPAASAHHTGHVATAATSSTRTSFLAALLPLGGLVAFLVSVLTEPEVQNEPAAVVAVFIAVVTPGVVGLLVVHSQPRNAVGWLLVTHSFIIGLVLTGETGQATTEAGRAFDQATQGIWVLLYICLVLLGYVFPTGRFLSTAMAAMGDLLPRRIRRVRRRRGVGPQRIPRSLPGSRGAPVDAAAGRRVRRGRLGRDCSSSREPRRHGRLRSELGSCDAEGAERLQLLWFTLGLARHPGHARAAASSTTP